MASETIRWGVLGTGNIAQMFAKDLLNDPVHKNTEKITHVVVAVASTSDVHQAREFLRQLEAPRAVEAYGSYKELTQDPNVDVIYVSTTHSHHHRHVRLCLEAGKNVLCESTSIFRNAETRDLMELARSKDLFLMETLWTQYFPLSFGRRGLDTLILPSSNEPGFQEVGWNNSHVGNCVKYHSTINADAASFSVVDSGINALAQNFGALNTTAMPNRNHTRLDRGVTVLMALPQWFEQYDDHPTAEPAKSCLPSSVLSEARLDSPVRILGDKSEVQIFPPVWRPTRTRLLAVDDVAQENMLEMPGPGKNTGWYNGHPLVSVNTAKEGGNMFWKADGVGTENMESRGGGKNLSWIEVAMIKEIARAARSRHDWSCMREEGTIRTSGQSRL